MQLGGELVAQELDQLLRLERGGEAGGAAVAPAPLRAGDRRDIHVVVDGAQRHLASPRRSGAVSSRTSAATFVPRTARRWSTIPSE